MTDIFFSYSSKDRDRVEAAHKALTERGFDVFWDLQVPAGIDWDRWIHARLDQSRCVIVFWSANSAASRNVRHEVAIAAEDGKLLQVMLEPLATRDLPMGALADQSAKLMDWRGDAADPEWAKLIAAVEEKATPRWLRQKVQGLEVALKGERQRVAEADTKARTLEEAHAREVAAQGDLRRERDKLKAQCDQLSNELGSLTAKTDGQSEGWKKLQAERDQLAASAKKLTKERDALKTERDLLLSRRDCPAADSDQSVKPGARRGPWETKPGPWETPAKPDQPIIRLGEQGPWGRPRPWGTPTQPRSRDWRLLFLFLTLLCSALAYLPHLIEIALQNWKILHHQSEFVALVRLPALLACFLAFVAMYGIDQVEIGPISGVILFGVPIAIGWGVQAFVPFADWWQLAYLIPAVLALAQLIAACLVAIEFLSS